jgi:cytochrome P450
VLVEERDQSTEKNTEFPDLLDLLLSSKDPLSSQRLTPKLVQNELIFSLFFAHAGFTSTLFWTLCLLASHLDIQDRVQKEVDSESDIKSLKFLELVIKESLRLYPPFPILHRTIAKSVKLGEFTIPAEVFFY